MRFPPDIDWGLTLPKIPLCALLAGNGHTVQTTIFDLEKTKTRKAEKFAVQEIFARKVEQKSKI